MPRVVKSSSPLNSRKPLAAGEPQTGPDNAAVREMRELLLNKAGETFARYGVRRTSVEDVADAADVSRPTFYRYFSGRQELVDAVVARRLEDMVERFGPEIWRARSLEKGLTEGAVKTLQACHGDEVFMELLHRAHRDRISDLARGASAFFEPIADSLWRPAIEKARARGEVREALHDDDIVHWLSSVHLLFLLRAEFDPDEVRHAMRTFVVPSLQP